MLRYETVDNVPKISLAVLQLTCSMVLGCSEHRSPNAPPKNSANTVPQYHKNNHQISTAKVQYRVEKRCHAEATTLYVKV